MTQTCKKNGLKAEVGRPEVENQSVMFNKTLFQKTNNLQEFKLFSGKSYVHIDSGRMYFRLKFGGEVTME